MQIFITSLFISNRIIKSEKGSFSRFTYFIGIILITLSISSMIIFALMLNGMQKSISNKIFNMSGHIHIQKTDYFQASPQDLSISIDNNNLKRIENLNIGINRIYPFVYSIGLFKSKKNISGVFFKGIDLKKDKYLHLIPYIQKGKFLESGDQNKIIIGKKIANMLDIKINDKILVYFLTNPPRYRKLEVKGIYKTNIPEIDEELIICDIALLQQVNNWSSNEVSGYEILLNKISNIENATLNISNLLDSNYTIKNIKREFSSIFDWLIILAKNKDILFTIIFIVLCANLASIILIQLIDRTYMIGVLKSLGAQDRTIGLIFFFNMLNILSKGIFFGNILGITLCIIQHFFKVIKLDPDGVYLDYAIVDWNLFNILSINLLTIVVILISTVSFLYIILKIQPVKKIEFK